VLRFKPQQCARQLAVQFLFGIPHLDTDWAEALEEFWDMNPSAMSADEEEQEASSSEEPVLEDEKGYVKKYVRGVMEHLEDLDEAVVAALDNWAPERVGLMEWAVLRLACSELFYNEDVPTRVVLSEAMRLADLYGDDHSARFVNGVLNRVIENRQEKDEEKDNA
jgi:N utilization substance protein B